jgi:hypothetical protein
MVGLLEIIDRLHDLITLNQIYSGANFWWKIRYVDANRIELSFRITLVRNVAAMTSRKRDADTYMDSLKIERGRFQRSISPDDYSEAQRYSVGTNQKIIIAVSFCVVLVRTVHSKKFFRLVRG